MKNARKFAIVVFIVLLGLSACSPPEPTDAAPEAKTSAPAATDTEATTATSTSIPQSSPTETQTPAALELEILETHIWTDASGQFQADALVRNPYDFPVSESESYITFFDSIGQVLLFDVYFDILDGGFGQILPGEIVPAILCLWCANYVEPDWDSYEIEIYVTEATPLTYSTDLEVVVDRFISMGGDYFEMGAMVENTGDQTLSIIYVSVIVRDQDGNFVGTGESTIYPAEGSAGIGPGMTKYFLVGVHASLIGEPVFEITAIGQ